MVLLPEKIKKFQVHTYFLMSITKYRPKASKGVIVLSSWSHQVTILFFLSSGNKHRRKQGNIISVVVKGNALSIYQVEKNIVVSNVSVLLTTTARHSVRLRRLLPFEVHEVRSSSEADPAER